MLFRKSFIPLLILFLTMSLLNACGTALEKPSGLENTQNQQIKTNQTKASEQENIESNNELNTNDQANLTIMHSIVISEETNEIILEPTEQEIVEGETALEALIAITKQHGIQLDYRGGKGATTFIQGIGNVYEFDRGVGSGWEFRINDKFPDRSAGIVTLCKGDHIEWVYTTDYNENIDQDRNSMSNDRECPK